MDPLEIFVDRNAEVPMLSRYEIHDCSRVVLKHKMVPCSLSPTGPPHTLNVLWRDCHALNGAAAGDLFYHWKPRTRRR